MSATKVSEPGDKDSSNAVSTHDDEQVSGSGSERDIDRASACAEPKGKSAENETHATCKSKKRRRQTSGMEKEIRK